MNTSSSLDDVLGTLQRRYAVDFRQYRRRFLDRRIRARMHALGIGSYVHYARLLAEDPGEYESLLGALSINVSAFMRDPAAFDALREAALIPLVHERERCGMRHLAIWSAGCSKGEEPYSVAMLLLDLLGASCPRWHLTLHGSDVNAKVLDEARRGWYTADSFSDLEADYLARYFSPATDGFQIDRRVRDLVLWNRQDLRNPPPRVQYDVILCRNVLIYYDHLEQALMVAHLLDHLAPGGYLMLGMAEMVPAAHAQQLMPVNGKLRLYRKVALTEEG
jgi:chemotaxis methyl-accepting protein methylase